MYFSTLALTWLGLASCGGSKECAVICHPPSILPDLVRSEKEKKKSQQKEEQPPSPPPECSVYRISKELHKDFLLLLLFFYENGPPFFLFNFATPLWLACARVTTLPTNHSQHTHTGHITYNTRAHHHHHRLTGPGPHFPISSQFYRATQSFKSNHVVYIYTRIMHGRRN